MIHAAYSVLDNYTVKLMNYVQLRKHPKFQETWNKSFSNEMGRLCQGVGKGKNGLGKIVEGKNNSNVIRFEDIPKDRLNKICYNSVLCEVRPVKKDPNRTQITNIWHKCMLPRGRRRQHSITRTLQTHD